MLRPDKYADEIARLRAELGQAKQRCRVATQLIIASIGSVGPEDLESAIGRLVAQLGQAQARETRLRDALMIIANSAYPNRKLHEGDHLWRWCRAEDTARQAIKEVS